nr:MAG TPA: protein of unknown function (DUF5383) [Bacteriophage sp.]
MNNFLSSLGIILIIFGVIKLIAYLVNKIGKQPK